MNGAVVKPYIKICLCEGIPLPNVRNSWLTTVLKIANEMTNYTLCNVLSLGIIFFVSQHLENFILY